MFFWILCNKVWTGFQEESAQKKKPLDENSSRHGKLLLRQEQQDHNPREKETHHIVDILVEKRSIWKSLDINFYKLYNKLYNYKKHKNYAYPSQSSSHSILSR